MKRTHLSSTCGKPLSSRYIANLPSTCVPLRQASPSSHGNSPTLDAVGCFQGRFAFVNGMKTVSLMRGELEPFYRTVQMVMLSAKAAFKHHAPTATLNIFQGTFWFDASSVMQDDHDVIWLECDAEQNTVAEALREHIIASGRLACHSARRSPCATADKPRRIHKYVVHTEAAAFDGVLGHLNHHHAAVVGSLCLASRYILNLNFQEISMLHIQIQGVIALKKGLTGPNANAVQFFPVSRDRFLIGNMDPVYFKPIMVNHNSLFGATVETRIHGLVDYQGTYTNHRAMKFHETVEQKVLGAGSLHEVEIPLRGDTGHMPIQTLQQIVNGIIPTSGITGLGHTRVTQDPNGRIHLYGSIALRKTIQRLQPGATPYLDNRGSWAQVSFDPGELTADPATVDTSAHIAAGVASIHPDLHQRMV